MGIKMDKQKLPIIFSVVGSLIVVMLDIGFIVDEFKINIVLAFAMIMYIEGLYLYLPYLFASTTRSGVVKFFDKILYGFVFVISVTGASLQASKNFVESYNLNQTTFAGIEEKKEDKQFYQTMLLENSKKLEKINEIPVEKRSWAERNEIERLTIDNSDYKKQLEIIKPVSEKEEKEVTQKTGLYRFLDLLKIFFSFMIAILIQWGNARCSNINSKFTVIKPVTEKQPEPEPLEPEKKKAHPWTEPELSRTEDHPLPSPNSQKNE